MKIRPLNTISLINSFKTGLACLIGFAITLILQIPSPQWTIITILVVMAAQNRVGGAIRKGWSRFFATIMGGVLAAVLLLLFSLHTYTLYVLILIFIFIFTYLAGVSKNYQDGFTLSSVTLVIILVTSTPQLHLAYDRSIEIILGVVIAICVTKFVYPIHSKSFIRKNLAQILRLTSQLYTLGICQKQSLYSISQYSNLEENIIQSLNLQPVLLFEASLESLKLKKKKTHFITIQRLERRLLRTIYMMYEALKTPKGILKQIVRSKAFVLLNQDIIETLNNLTAKLDNKKTELIKLDLKIHLDEIITDIKQNWDRISFNEQVTASTFIFCTQYLTKILYRLTIMVNKI